MAEQRNFHTRNEAEAAISLTEWVLYIVKKWRVILCLILIGLLVGAGLSMVPKESREAQIEEIDMKEVNMDRVKLYHDYNMLFEEQLKNEESSLYMHFDPDSVYQNVKKYYLTAENKEIDLVGMRFRGFLDNETLWKDLFELLDGKYTYKQLHEMISYSFSVNPMNNVQVRSDIDLDTLQRTATYTINVIGDQEELVRKISDFLDPYLDAFIERCIRENPGCQVENLGERMIYPRLNWILDSQQQTIHHRNDLFQAREKIKGTMTDDEKALYSLIYGEEKEEEVEPRSLLSYLKMPILLSVLFAALAVGYLAVRFLLSGQIRNTDELTDSFGLPVLALYRKTAHKKGIDGMLERIGEKNERRENSKAYVVNALHILKKTPVLLCGDTENTDIRVFMEELSEDDQTVTYCGLLQADEQAQLAAKNAKAIVLVTQLDKTTQDQVEREVEIALERDLPLAGSIVVK